MNEQVSDLAVEMMRHSLATYQAEVSLSACVCVTVSRQRCVDREILSPRQCKDFQQRSAFALRSNIAYNPVCTQSVRVRNVCPPLTYIPVLIVPTYLATRRAVYESPEE